MIPVVKPEFVEFIPEKLEPGKLYISKAYATAQHLCCCGCGQRVVTPLSATHWKLTVDGEYVTLFPSIGNWSFPCRSHYWIKRNRVIESYDMTAQEIQAGRRFDAKVKERHFGDKPVVAPSVDPTEANPSPPVTAPPGIVDRLLKWLFG